MQNKIWLNRPQKIAHLVNAHTEVGIMGRGTGKTQGRIAPRSIHGANNMPRGATGIIGATYTQLLDRTLPPLLKSWDMFGYIENVHYWVRKYPDEKLNIPKPIYKVLTPKHSIFWYTGHIFHLISQDRPGLANGKTLDALIGDEARFMNHERYLSDIVPINRGNKEYFGHFPHHHMVTLYSDMPTTPAGRWLFEYEKHMDNELVNDIVSLQIHINKLKAEFNAEQTSKTRKIYLARKIDDRIAIINNMRKGTVFYSEASSLENVAILGEDQIAQWRRELLWPVFQASVLNKRLIHVEESFYNTFDEHKHTYNNFNYDFIDEQCNSYKSDNSCERDGDLLSNKPLDMAFDYGSHINCVVVGQDHQKFYRIINAMYVKGDLRLHDLLDKIIRYYDKHGKKEINYFYDHTAQVTDTTRVTRISEEVVKHFTSHGWVVNEFNIGQQPSHETRFRLFQNVFAEQDSKYKPCRINSSNGSDLVTSISQAGVIQTKDGFQKDKRNEKNKYFPQEEATHFTDAFDTLYIGKFKNQYGYSLPVLGVTL